MRETGLEPPFEHAIALVEPARLGARAPLDALPVGEIAATITVTPARGQKADFYRRQFFRDAMGDDGGRAQRLPAAGLSGALWRRDVLLSAAARRRRS